MNNEKDNSYKLYLGKGNTNEFILLNSEKCDKLNIKSSNYVISTLNTEFKEVKYNMNDFINTNKSKIINYETILYIRSDNPGNEYKILNSKEKWIWKKYHYKKIDNKYKRFIKHSKECFIEYECVKI